MMHKNLSSLHLRCDTLCKTLMVILSSKDRSPKHGSSASLTPDLDGVLDGLAAARAHLAHVLPRVLVLGQADDQGGAVVGSGGADLNLKHRVTRFEK